jgi:type VI secretion system secreted protein VgrG
MTRVVRAHTPLDESQLLFRSMRGTEGLSQLFEFEVDLLSPSASLDLKSVLGKPLTLEIQTAGSQPRYLNGQVIRFSMIGREGGTERHTVYRATVRPWLWYLTRSSDNKIFQNKSVVEILEEVFGDYGFAFEKQLSGSYRQWEYCVQYNESDYAFVSRLMELEGIYYWFKHEKNQHTLVLSDDIGAHDPMPGYETIDYFASDRDITEDMEVIREWQPSEEVRSGSYTVDDFNFTTPKGELINVRSQPRGHDNADYEMYEWLGDYPAAGDGEHYAKVRLEESQSLAQRSSGHSTVRGMAPGYKFTMRNSPRSDDNQEYLAVAVSYALREGGYATGSEPGSYDFNFVVQPTALAFRAPRQTPVPRTSGPQTATVVGPEGEEIWTDQYGRVKVQFHWDRYGQRNENSSRFVRVSHIWAGERFGGVFTPRIGQEVIVDFIGGRIDRPVIVGRVYNADQMPPFSLPGEATKSGIVTRSSKGGSEATANAFVFEDKMGAEQILVHAERNLDVEVEGDETHTTEKTRTTLIKGHESATYESGEERHITQGAVETIDGGEERTVTGGAKETVTDGEKRTITGGAAGDRQCLRRQAGAGPACDGRDRHQDGVGADHGLQQHQLHGQHHQLHAQRGRRRPQHAGLHRQCRRPGLGRPAERRRVEPACEAVHRRDRPVRHQAAGGWSEHHAQRRLRELVVPVLARCVHQHQGQCEEPLCHEHHPEKGAVRGHRQSEAQQEMSADRAERKGTTWKE